MGADTKIEWCDKTFNPIRGCTKISAGCKNCYAETLSHRNPGTLGVWGPKGTRVVASEAMWREPLKWDRVAEFAGELYDAVKDDPKYAGRAIYEGRPRVFCASLADVFEDWQGPMTTAGGLQLWKRTVSVDPAPGVTGELYSRQWTTSDHYPDTIALTMDDVRRRLFALIDATPNLDWLLLTKRPENIERMMPPRDLGERDEGIAEGDYGYYSDPDHAFRRPNLWIGTSVENQETADARIPHLLQVPAAVRFLSVEPLLGPVSLTDRPWWDHRSEHAFFKAAFPNARPPVDWVIVGGESGPNARPCNVEWIRSIVQQCRAAGVPVFVKQLGANVVDQCDECTPDATGWPEEGPVDWDTGNITLRDKKGGAIGEWPENLQVREFPRQGGE